MADENQREERETAGPLPQDKPAPIEVVPPGDWLLGSLIGLANHGSSFPITLNCGGMLVTGILIGGAEYLKRFSEMMEIAYPGEMDPAMKSWFELYAPVYEDPGPVFNSEDPFATPTFIHLRDATFISPGARAIPNNGGVLWRGRLAEVDGFCWGTLGEPSAAR